MSGLDKMKARILEEAESSARDILDRAGEEADRILREAGTAADAAAAEIAAGRCVIPWNGKGAPGLPRICRGNRQSLRQSRR